MEPDIIVLVTRSIERLIIVIFGGISILSGVYLLLRNVSGLSNAEWKSQVFTLKLAKVSPGVIISAFGMIVLVVSMNTQLTIGTEDITLGEAKPKGKIAFVGGQASNEKKFSQALNTVTNFIRRDLQMNDKILPMRKKELLEAETVISDFHQNMLLNKFGDDFIWYNQVRKREVPLVDENEKEKYIEMKGYFEDEIK